MKPKAILFDSQYIPHMDYLENLRIDSDSKLRAPFLCQCFAEPSYASLGHGIVGLTSISVNTSGTRYIDDASRLTILDPKIRSRSSNESERRCRMNAQDCVPLLVSHFMNHTVPSKACVVHNDVKLASSELSSFLYEVIDVGVVQHVAGNGFRLSTGAVDAVCCRIRLVCKGVSFQSLRS